MELSPLLALIDMGSLTLPRFQRGYVWKRPDVSKLMRSLYKGYPVGSLLIWETHATRDIIRGEQPLAPGAHKLLLDGQQRITTLYGIINDKVPPFSDGNTASFRNLYFNVETQVFEFYGPVRMKNDPLWISVTEVMQRGLDPFFERFAALENKTVYFSRVNQLANIKNRQFHIETVSGVDKDIDTVVDIFNQVNSGGTKLSKGDLALAKISAYWPEARGEMQVRLDRWRQMGYDKFNLDWVLRCINAILTGQSDFAELDKHACDAAKICDGLKRAEKQVDFVLNHIAGRLGLDHQRVLGSPNSLPAIIRYFDNLSKLPNQKTIDRLLYWYVHAMLWGRYSGPVETVIRQDITAVDGNDDAIAALIEQLRRSRGGLRIEAQHFSDWSRGSRFYPLLYMLTRMNGTRDLCSGIELKQSLLGKMSYLELHHIFPKSKLYQAHYRRPEVNALANFTFLTAACNHSISATLPEVYLPQCEQEQPGVLQSHWIPQDEQLWKIENYLDFLAARRELLAKAANDFLDKLYHGTMHADESTSFVHGQAALPRPASIASDEEEAILVEASEWMRSKNLPSGEYGYLLRDGYSGAEYVLDLVWPRGIQTDRSEPVALLIDEDAETLQAAQHEFHCFTSLANLQAYVQRDILGE